MDAFQAAASAVALLELCVKVGRFIYSVRQTAVTVREELDHIVKEIQSLQNVGKLIVEFGPIFQELAPQLPLQQAKVLLDLDTGALNVIHECGEHVRAVEALIREVQGSTSHDKTGFVDATKTVLRSSKRKDDLLRLRHNLQSGQSRLQAFYTSLNIVQVRANSTSLRQTSDQIRKLGFDLKRQISQINQRGDQPNAELLSPVEGVLGTVKLNKHFDVPRSVGGSFTGRESQLQELRHAFDESEPNPLTTPRVFVIHGFPGSGKTDFSLKFAEQYRDSFWAVFVLQADSSDLLLNSFKRIVQYADRQVEPNLAAAKHWLANQELPWLLIMDNADDPELDIASYLPASASGCVLITTRNRDLRIHGNVGARSFAFERLQPHEAKVVLLRAADEPSPPRPHADEAASRISEELQCLPLALVSAGKTIRSKLCTWRSYLDWYRKSCDHISRRLSSGGGFSEVEAARLTVIPTLEPHFMRLERSQDRTSIDALELIHTLGYFHHRNISFKLLRLVAKNASKVAIGSDRNENQSKSSSSTRGPPIAIGDRIRAVVLRMVNGPATLPDVLRNITKDNLDEHRLRAALSKLEDLNLIRCDDDGNDETETETENKSRSRSRPRSRDDDDSSSDFDDSERNYSLHPLVHSWVRQRHFSLWKKSVWCEAANTALAQCVVLETKAFTGGGSSYFDARDLLPHIHHARLCKQRIDDQLQQNVSSANLFRSSLVALHLVPNGSSWLTDIQNASRTMKYSLVYSLCGDFRRAAKLQSEVRSFVISKRGMNDQISIHVSLALASTLQHLTEFGEAAEIMSEVVQACRAIYGSKHHQTLTVIDQYGLLLLYHGRLRECTQSHEEALSGFTALGPGYLRQGLIAKAHLGAVRAKYLEFDQSKILCQEAVDGLEQLDDNDEEILWAKEALALAHGELGEARKAYDLMQDIYHKREASLGKQHPFTLWAAVNKSRALWRMGSFDEALKLLDEPREIAAMTLGTQHFGYLAGETLRACILTDQGQFVEAQTLLTTVDETHEKLKATRGTDHADRVIALGHQLDLYQTQREYQLAIKTGNKILDILRSINKQGLGLQHPMRARVENKIAELATISNEGTQRPSESPEDIRQRNIFTFDMSPEVPLHNPDAPGLMSFRSHST